MTKYKLKIIVQGKELLSDKPDTHQFTSGVYTDVNDILPDVIAFLKSSSGDFFEDTLLKEQLPDIDIPAFELPHFDRLYQKSESIADMPHEETPLENTGTEYNLDADLKVDEDEVVDSTVSNTNTTDDSLSDDNDSDDDAVASQATDDEMPVVDGSTDDTEYENGLRSLDQFDDDEDTSFDF